MQETADYVQEIIDVLGDMNFAIYEVSLQSGEVTVVRATERIVKETKGRGFMWEDLFRRGIGYIVLEYRDAFREKFSLEAMRKAKENGEKKENVCLPSAASGSMALYRCDGVF